MKLGFLKKIKGFLITYKRLFLAFVLILIVFLIPLGFYKDLEDKEIPFFSDRQDSNLDSCEDCVKRKIDGKLVPSENKNPQLTAIIIDNHPQSRPQSGLSEAALVYEAEVEGGATRYLAVFTGDEELEKIGPIRSARPYFLDWGEDLSSLFVHCGGSPATLANLALSNLVNLDQFYDYQYFWRDNERLAPHNIYTSSKLINDFLKSTNQEADGYLGWNFKSPEPLKKRGEEKTISIPFDSGYQVKWLYDRDENEYVRYLDGEIHTDAEGEVVTTHNLILHYLKTKTIDEKLRLELVNRGVGNAMICRDGECQEVNWQKENPKERSRYYTPEGEKFLFNPGTTWIEIIEKSKKEKVKIER